MGRTRSYRRDVRNKAIARKKNIAKHIYGWDYYNHDGMYSKGKIHCSCYLCAFGKYDPNQKTESDMRKIESMDSQLDDYLNNR